MWWLTLDRWNSGKSCWQAIFLMPCLCTVAQNFIMFLEFSVFYMEHFEKWGFLLWETRSGNLSTSNVLKFWCLVTGNLSMTNILGFCFTRQSYFFYLFNFPGVTLKSQGHDSSGTFVDIGLNKVHDLVLLRFLLFDSGNWLWLFKRMVLFTGTSMLILKCCLV